jgi:hypothetical protein
MQIRAGADESFFTPRRGKPHERSKAPIVEWKRRKTLGEFLSAVSLLVPRYPQALWSLRGRSVAVWGRFVTLIKPSFGHVAASWPQSCAYMAKWT